MFSLRILHSFLLYVLIFTSPPTNFCAPTPPSLFYLRSGGPHGSSDGSSWTNALSEIPSSFTTHSAIYYFAEGDFTGGSTDITHSHDLVYEPDRDYRGSDWIVFRRATASDHGTDDGWNPSFGIGQARLPKLMVRTSRIRIDGRMDGIDYVGDALLLEPSRAVAESRYGFFIPSVGCNPGLTEPRNTSPLYVRGTFDSSGEVTIRYLEMYGLEVQHCGLQGEMTHQAYDIFYATFGLENLIIADCYWHDTNRAHITITQGHHFTVERSLFFRAGNHQEAGAISIIGEHILFMNNVVQDSKNNFWSCGRAGSKHVRLYNNVWSMSPGWGWSVYNLFDCGSSVAVGDVHIDHNVIMNVIGLHLGIRVSPYSSNVRHFNNIYVNNTVNAIILYSVIHHDYNYLWGNYRVEGTIRNLDDSLNERRGEIGTRDIFVDSAMGDVRLVEPPENGGRLGIDLTSDFAGATRCKWTKGIFEWDPEGDCVGYNIVTQAIAIGLSMSGVAAGILVAFIILIFVVVALMAKCSSGSSKKK